MTQTKNIINGEMDWIDAGRSTGLISDTSLGMPGDTIHVMSPDGRTADATILSTSVRKFNGRNVWGALVTKSTETQP